MATTISTSFTGRLREAFLWGQHDCCLFVADCAEAVCGIDSAGDYRGTYDSALGARVNIPYNRAM
ncbi:DUF6950 family protein [Yersinia nurmii]|uniref:DUF6950 family protein n=1 Tax=Yersinia nurmii TaxID=685706 RepID=UPI0038B503A6